MSMITKANSVNSQVIAFIIIETAVVMLLIVFAISFKDVTARQALILAVTNSVSNLLGLGAGILTGQASKTQTLSSDPLDGSKTAQTVESAQVQETK